MQSSGEQVGHVHWHFIDLGRVVELDVAKDANVIASNEVDGNALSAKTSATADTVDVVLSIAGKIVVDDQAYLLNINASSPDVGADEDTTVALSKVAHDTVALFLWHLTMHAAYCEIGFSHLVRQPVDLATSIAEDDCLSDRQGIVEVTQGVELPIFFLDCNEVLLQTFEGQLITLDENADRVCHELGRHIEDIIGKSSRDHDYLSRRWEVSVDVVDLLSEASIQELVGFVENKHLNVPCP